MSGSFPVDEKELIRRPETLRMLERQGYSLLDRIDSRLGDRLTTPDICSLYLDKLKYFYEKSGRGYFLFRALMFCAHRHILIPDWANHALHKHFGRWTTCEVKTLDEAFNFRYRKGQHLRAARLKRELSPPVYRRIMELKRQGQPIDQNLFRQVGKEFQISRERVRRYYSSAKKDLFRSRNSPGVHGNLKFP